VLSGRGLCDGLITRTKESYRLWCVVECDLETSRMRRPWPTGGSCAKKKVGSVWYVVSLLFVSICYFLIIRLMFLMLFFMFVFLFL